MSLPEPTQGGTQACHWNPQDSAQASNQERTPNVEQAPYWRILGNEEQGQAMVFGSRCANPRNLWRRLWLARVAPRTPQMRPE